MLDTCLALTRLSAIGLARSNVSQSTKRASARYCGKMNIGDSITYVGRRWVVVGFTPFSVQPFQVQLESVETAEQRWVSWPPLEAVERAALRLQPKRTESRRPNDV